MNLEDVNSTGEWACNTIIVKGTFEGADVDETMKCGLYGIPWMENSYNNIISPTQYSFACNQMQFSGKNYTVQFNGLQVRRYMLYNYLQLFYNHYIIYGE